MTIIEAINQVDKLKPNTHSQETKIQWLSALDGKIKRSIIDTHERGECLSMGFWFDGYNENTPLDMELIAPAPYDEMYRHYLSAKIDEVNGEFERYNASITLFNAEYEAFENDYNRTHLPKSAGNRFLW